MERLHWLFRVALPFVTVGLLVLTVAPFVFDQPDFQTVEWVAIFAAMALGGLVLLYWRMRQRVLVLEAERNEHDRRQAVKEMLGGLDGQAAILLGNADATDDEVMAWTKAAVAEIAPALGVAEAQLFASNTGFPAADYVSTSGLSGRRGLYVTHRRERLADLIRRADTIVIDQDWMPPAPSDDAPESQS